MTKLRAWRCFSVVMALMLTLGVCAMAMPPSPALADGGTWDIQTVDDIDVMSTSLALDSNGYPHISYTTGFGDSLHYARWTGTAWVKEMVDDVPAIVTSLALDGNDLPHISYTTFAIGDNSLHYAHWTGTAWAKETVDESDVWNCSLALDSNDRPHISYATVDLKGSLHYARWTGTAWAKEVVDESDVISTSIALDSNDRPHISYATGGLFSLHYAHWTGTAWAKETVDESDVISTSIALDSNDRPHISYATVDLTGSLHYAHWTGTAWAKETVDPADVWDTSMALDSNNLPHISYFVIIGEPFIPDDAGDHIVGGMLKYAHWTGTAWDIQTVDEETVTLDGVDGDGLGTLVIGGEWSSIALDSSDLPHISYGTLVPSVSVSSLHYARLIPPDTSTVNTATGTGTATFSTSAGGITNLTAVAQTAITCAQSALQFPHGLFFFNIVGLNPGATVTVTITLPSYMPAGTQYWKCQNGTWIDCTSLLGDDDGDNVLTLTLTDGGLGDADGIADGTIIDPGGPVLKVKIAPPAKPRVSPLSPASMSVQSLSINPQQAYANQSIIITTNVVNTGDEAGNLVVTLKINGQVEQTKMVSVGPQGTQPVKFTVTKAQPGTYTVDIGGQQGSFTILGAGSTTTSKGASVGLIVLLGVLILATVVVLILTFRRPA